MFSLFNKYTLRFIFVSWTNAYMIKILEMDARVIIQGPFCRLNEKKNNFGNQNCVTPLFRDGCCSFKLANTLTVNLYIWKSNDIIVHCILLYCIIHISIMRHSGIPKTVIRVPTVLSWSANRDRTYTHRQKLSNTTFFSETLFWKLQNGICG